MKAKQFFRQVPWLEGLVLGMIAWVLIQNLLFLPSVGLADNGDFGRMMAKVGLEHHSDIQAERYNYYFDRLYKIVPPTTPIIGDFISSEVFFQLAAFWIGLPFAINGLWDIRFLGGVHIFGLLLGVASVLYAVRGIGLRQRLLAAGFLILTLTDLRLTAYFNSFYSEPAFLIFLLYWLAAGLAWIQKAGRNWPALVFFYGLSGLIITVKPQDTLLGFLFAAGGLGIALLKKDRLQLTLSAIFSVGLILVTLVYFQLTPQRFKRANLFNIVFHDILATSNTNEGLDFFNLPRDLASYKGRDYYEEGSLVNDPKFVREFFQRSGYSDVIRYYLSHPKWVFEQLNRGLPQVFQMRLDFLGNYEQESGQPPLSHVQRFTFWSDFKQDIVPKSNFFVLLMYSMPILGSIILWFRRPTSRPYVLLFVLLLGLTVVLFIMTMLAGGMRDTAKQLWEFNFLWDVILGFGMVGLVGFFRPMESDRQKQSKIA